MAKAAVLAGCVVAGLVLVAPGQAGADRRGPASLEFVGSYDSGAGETGSEIVAFDQRTRTMLVTNGALNRIDVVSIARPEAPVLLRSVELAPYGASVQSVAAHKGLGVAAVGGATVLDPGTAVFFDIRTGTVVGTAPTGVLPDAVTWSDDGTTVVVANEGEPRCVTGPERTPTTDPTLAENPEGSITTIRVEKNGRRLTATQIGFGAYDDDLAALQAAGVRVGTWPGSTVAQDLEPEYPTIVGRTAYVTLQENNAVAVVDLRRAEVTAIVPLGLKDHRLPENALDASDRDGGYQLQNWPVDGMFMPDTVASARIRHRDYLFTANEGDTRTYFAGLDNAEVEGQECFSDEVRVRSLAGGLDPAAFTDTATVAALRDNAAMGRLKVSAVAPSVAGSAGYTSLASFGGRSFSIWSADGALVWDSGSLFETTVNSIDPAHWPDTEGNNAPWTTAAYDNRSDDKGPEPEAIAVGSDRGRTYAFVGLERSGGIMVFDVSTPTAPVFLQWVTVAGEISPEGMRFVPRGEAPGRHALLLVANEISGTTTIYELEN